MSAHPGLGKVPIYLVTMDTPKGRVELEVPSYGGPDRAWKRAWLTGLQARWGDVDDILRVSVVEIDPETNEAVQCQWFALCDHVATHTQAHPVLGDVPICDRCQAKYDALGG